MGLKTGQAGLNLIKQFEGCRLTAYKCPAGVLTIGYGHTAGVKAGQTITQAQADKMLVDDVERFERNVNKYYDKYRWNQNEFDALVSFAYNNGSIDQLTKAGTRSREVIANKMLEYINKGTAFEAGLTRRRKAERELFLKGCEELPTLRKGSRGLYVEELQDMLDKRGYTLKVDGKFGSETEEAVEAFQADNGLKVDGVVGSKTWGKLNT